MAEFHGICPRCSEAMDHPGGGSRMGVDRKPVICGPCCYDEAIRDASGDAPIPPPDWPVTRRKYEPPSVADLI